MVDSISTNYKRSSQNAHSWLWKLIYKYEYKHLVKEENHSVTFFNATFLVNKSEQEFWQTHTNKPVVWLPNGIKENLFNYNKINETTKQPSLVFIGKMDYQPNVDAVFWFVKNVWHLVNNYANFYIVGAKPSKKVLRLAKMYPRVFVTGYLPDPYSIMNAASIVISPMQTGGGVQNKILEGMALGKLNIATTLGAGSIHKAIAGEHFLVEDNPLAMASLINNAIENPEKYVTVAKKGKELVSELYTWNNFETVLINTINNILS